MCGGMSLLLPGLRFNDSIVLDASYQNWRIGDSRIARRLLSSYSRKRSAGAKVNESCTWAGNAYGARGTKARERGLLTLAKLLPGLPPRGSLPRPELMSASSFAETVDDLASNSLLRARIARLSRSTPIPDAVSVEITIRCDRRM